MCLYVSSPGVRVLTAMCHRMDPPGEARPTGVLKAERDECKLTLPPASDKELRCLAEDRPGN